MTNHKPLHNTVSELRAAYLAGDTTPTQVVAEALGIIERTDKDIHAFLDVYKEQATAAAAAATARFAAKETNLPPLLGVPVAIKNNILIKGERATAGSKMLEHYRASYDATIIERLRAAGAIFIGATNMDEFAMGGSTEHSAYGPTRNPLAPTRVPGGSSGGSAAAVAMGAAPVAIGTDTGGSIRQPASYCGLVGFKPTYGAVSRYGLVAMGSSLDQAGPLTHTVADAKLIHEVMVGRDSYDATSRDYPVSSYVKGTPLTFGVPRSFLKDGVDADVLALFDKHCAAITAAGHKVVDIELPLFEQGLAAYYIVMPAEVSSNLARYDGIRYGLSVPGNDLLAVYENSRAEGLGAEVKRRILLGTYVLSSGYYDAYYKKAELVRTKMRAELAQVFSSVDVIVTPTAPTPAFRLGEQADPLSMYRQDIFTVPVNLTGIPALTFPMGEVNRDADCLPVGVQYSAPLGHDTRLLEIGIALYDERSL
ncbi:Asp-tRNA(Asn)/Glu-tRNA(Gln) amidotransferase subunit GatA [Patescibacteria group bacterium]|nr:Asp-tRNA(Asn)/Glu-tRNA(Gln) amidotransferase subunit GatA [Patescibacteria group bacterium]